MKNKYNRQENYAFLEEIQNKFIDYYKNQGTKELDAVKISSGMDPTVRFIGSHISVMKPYLFQEDIPETGLFMQQDCVRTQNLRRIYDDSFTPMWASFFPSLGILYPEGNLEKVSNDIFNYLHNDLNIEKDNLRINISSDDTDLIYSCKKAGKEDELVYDTKSPQYYRHGIGIDGVIGRNCNLTIRNETSGDFLDVGNIIVLENDKETLGVEVAIGASNVAKQVQGLDHVLDSFYIPGLQEQTESIRRRFEDSLLVSTMLYSEGLRPNTKKGPGRNLRDYLKAISYFTKECDLESKDLCGIISSLEEGVFNKMVNAEEITEKVGFYMGGHNNTHGK